MTPSPLLTEFAPAKINLCLHVTGQRADGYHLLDSLVVFAAVGDLLHGNPAAVDSLELAGPFGACLPADLDNLVLQAARLHASDFPVAFRLEKNLPPASGIGGGSADAAAAVRLIDRLRQIESWKDALDLQALGRLGADIPVCLNPLPARMRGIGEVIERNLKLPQGWIVLVNPGVEVPTPAVFRALPQKCNPPLPAVLPEWPDLPALAGWLSGQRNDLEAPARQIAPVIGRVLDLLAAQAGQQLTRMSGSGATCFALFAEERLARAAAEAIGQAQPGWWISAARLMV